MKNVRFFSLLDIANWQLAPNETSVELPELQRGFVWKNSQIEGLWDSLLRGFPIGSFLLSKNGDEKLFIMDGQQRATSIALGYYNPWVNENSNQIFWSLKKVPIIWIDLAPKEKTMTQKYVLRMVTQSHPWGYQNINNATTLSVSDRRNALLQLRKNPENKMQGYTQFSLKNVFPFDSSLPVPLSFVIMSVKSSNWQEKLIELCNANLPHKHIQTKYLKSNYIDKLASFITSDKFDKNIIQAIKNLNDIEIPCIVANKEILESEDEQTGEDPTLFVRLNSSGTRIAGEELIYSIYKATFPNSKKLVENVGLGFIAPSLVITLVSRLAWSELNNNDYPYPINVNDFRKRIKSAKFVQKMNKLIGDENISPSGILFQKVLDLFLLKNDLNIPPVLVKNILNSSPELLLLILQWLKINNIQNLSDKEKKRILSFFTALCWFGRDNGRYCREVWTSLTTENFWNKKTLSKPYYKNNDYIMYPLVQPHVLRSFLIEQVVEKKVVWDNLYTKDGDNINEQYKKILRETKEDEYDSQELINGIWGNFIDSLIDNKSLLLFAQREYINKEFGDFNQLDTLEDTNAPWDLDHIYPKSWVHRKWHVNENIRHWTWTIGNLRAISLEDNRSENNRESPSERLFEVKEKSFIKDNDWEFWNKITGHINEGDIKNTKKYLSAVIHRLCNIYEEWYSTLNVGELFNFEKN
ncbi:hypothetical protein AGMMS49944_10240 [Spirochaetia bacterium]|nr:hypothetical protein AGMMS49944_10240 [Spirochaetia bacterium]